MKTAGLLRSIAVAVALGMAAAASAEAAELKFANYMAPTNPYEKGTFLPFAETVSALTDGAVTVRLYSGGELGAGPVDQYNRALDGIADLAVGLPGYTAANFPLTLLTELPGVLDEATGTETLWKHIDTIEPEFRRVKLVALWSNAQNLLYTRGKAVHTPADVAGLKIRVPSRNAGLVVQAWGGTPVSMPVSDVYNSLQTGVIDGALIDGTATKAFKLGEVAEHLTVGMQTTISPFFIVMNRDSFEALSPDQQAAIEKAGKEASVNGNATQLREAKAGIEAFAALGKDVIRLTPDEAAAFDAKAAEARRQAVAEATAAGLPAEDVVSAMMAR